MADIKPITHERAIARAQEALQAIHEMPKTLTDEQAFSFSMVLATTAQVYATLAVATKP